MMPAFLPGFDMPTPAARFTDGEGSARLAKEFGDGRWADLLEAHGRILRQAFSAQAGHEVDTQGHSFFVVFTRAIAAVLASLAFLAVPVARSLRDLRARRLGVARLSGVPIRGRTP
jgi:class 3 adenylate cyclase